MTSVEFYETVTRVKCYHVRKGDTVVHDVIHPKHPLGVSIKPVGTVVSFTERTVTVCVGHKNKRIAIREFIELQFIYRHISATF